MPRIITFPIDIRLVDNMWLRLMIYQTFVAQFCCTICCATKLHTLQQNAQQTWHRYRRRCLISATLLLGAIVKVHKRKRPELIKEVSGHVSGLNSVRDEVLAYHSLLRELMQSINKAIQQRIILKSQKAVTSNKSFYLHTTQTIKWRKQPK